MLRDLSPALLAELGARLRDDTLRPVEPRYLEEPRGRYHGRAAAVAAPRTPAEVAEILRFAGEARIAVVPYGGGTGLVAGQIAEGGPLPLLLSLERMRAIRTVHAEEAVLVAEAGAPVATVQEAVREAGLLFPLSYGSEGTAQIGAALAVNSGGTGVLRYGNARELCLGVEAVLPDGSIHHGLKRLRKDNTGYDLRGLLIGSEGTLGVITAAALRLFPRPERQAAALLSVASPEAALTLLNRARDRVGEAVSAFELLSGTGLRFLSEAGMAARWPLADVPAWAVLIDLGTGAGSDPGAALEALFEAALEDGLAVDGLLSQSEAQRAAFWTLREAIPEANRKIGAVASHDISLPLGEIARFIAETTPAIEAMGALRVNTFGHLGDGNLHFNVFPASGRRREEFDDLRAAVTEVIHARTVALGGSFSAEHGIGRLKVGDLERWGDPAKLAAMRAIKAALDPYGIMNPGAVLRLR
ncbi:FAD-binding oxidoreductase [Palleronia sp. KMU-117]|uniref:FAD-binding oxidoreductase n=1 Tax=Palleronia sp. KMU-117 TaxID=3434108 RepID=UPI003D728FD0